MQPFIDYAVQAFAPHPKADAKQQRHAKPAAEEKIQHHIHCIPLKFSQYGLLNMTQAPCKQFTGRL